MGVGRFVCVFVPFALTSASIVCLLIVGLAGVTSSNISMFTIDTKNLSISASDIASIASEFSRRSPSDPSDLSQIGSISLTAHDLSLADTYSVMLWNYEATTNGHLVRSKPGYNWAAATVNTSSITQLATAHGLPLTVPTIVSDLVTTFVVFSRWSQIIFIIACVLGGVTLLLGLVSICSRIGSCLTFIVSGISTAAIITFAAMVTFIAVTVVAAVDKVGKDVNLSATVGRWYLIISWLAAATSLAADLFWLFTICCCSPDSSRNRKRRSRAEEDEKPLRGYSRVENPSNPSVYTYNPPQSFPLQNVKVQQTGAAYEPYSHQPV